MTCYLYNISADSRQLVKVDNSTPYIEARTAVKPTAPIDIISPNFIFDYSAAALACNYIYCAEFGRYYFVKNIAVDTAGRINITCAVDVLQTYANQIKNSYATILRSESVGQPTKYIDNKLPVFPSKKNVTSIIMDQVDVPLNSQLSTSDGDNYLLTVVGGSPTFE